MSRGRRILSSVALAAAGTGLAAVAAAPVASAATPVAAIQARAEATVVGHFEKFISHSSFELKAMHETIVVKTTGMTHITESGKKISLHTIKKGWLLTVKGPESMHTIEAASIAVDTM